VYRGGEKFASVAAEKKDEEGFALFRGREIV